MAKQSAEAWRNTRQIRNTIRIESLVFYIVCRAITFEEAGTVNKPFTYVANTFAYAAEGFAYIAESVAQVAGSVAQVAESVATVNEGLETTGESLETVSGG